MKPVGGSSPSNVGVINTPQTTSNTKSASPAKAEDTKAKAVDPEVSRRAHEAMSNDPTAMMMKAQLQASPSNDIKTLAEKAMSSKLDGAAGISKSEYEALQAAYKQPQKQESLKWLEKNQPHLHAALTSGLDYQGYVGTTIGTLNLTRSGDELKQDASQRSQKLDQLPPLHQFGTNGLPNTVPGADPLGNLPEANKQVNGYKTGDNYTKVIGDDLANISTKMSGIVGADVPNPPSAKAAKAYFQGMADRGATPDQIKKEYGEYLKTFYRHPGGVDWKPKLDPNNLDASFKQQPVAKDGKRLIDCEGFSALTENVLGGIKKNGQPMFDIMHAASSVHVIAGVFPHGGDPKKGFIVDNSEIHDVTMNPLAEKEFDRTANADTQLQYLTRTHMEKFKEGKADSYGHTYNDMKSPFQKVK
jgi:hypothetical protein